MSAAATITVPDDGLVIIADETMPRDQGRIDLTAGIFRVHPLEAIRLNNEGHPITELHAACAYIAEHACDQLDQLEQRLYDDTGVAR